MPHWQKQERPFGRASKFPSAFSSTSTSRPHRLQITREQPRVQVPESSYSSLSTKKQAHTTFSTHYQNHDQAGEPFHQRMADSPKVQMDLDARAAEINQKLKGKLGLATQSNAASPAISPAGSTQNPSVGTTPTKGAFMPHQLPKLPPKTTAEASANDIAALITSISSNNLRGSGKSDGANLQGTERPNSATDAQAGASENSSREEGEVSSGGETPKATPVQKLTMLPPKKPAASQRPPPTGYKFRGAASFPTEVNEPQNRAPSRTARHDLGNIRERHQPDKHDVRTTAPSYKTNTGKIENSGGYRKALNAGTDTDSVKKSLNRVLDHDADLRDWLVLTNYHDVETRNRKLERHRTLAKLAKERERIEEEERKLMEEEDLDMSIRRSLSGAISKDSPVKTPATMPFDSRNITPVSPQKAIEQYEGRTVARVIPAKRHYSQDFDTRTEMLPAKRYCSQDSEPRRPEKIARMDKDRRGQPFPPASVPSSPPIGPRIYQGPRKGAVVINTHQDYFDDPYSPAPREVYVSQREVYSPQRHILPPQESDARPRMERHDERYGGYRDQPRKYDSYKGGGARREPSPRRGMGSGSRARFSPSFGLDLGRIGETRFFIVKSFNEDNVRKCMEDGVWATQTKNGHVLTSAFANCKNVILFFSINKSRAFQGYARMTTAPSPDTPRPKWMNGIHWDVSPPFRVEWLSTVPVHFSLVRNLNNSYNEDVPVLVGKDGQEIDPHCGRELLRIMRSEYEKRKDFVAGPGMSHGRGRNSSFGEHGKVVVEED